jgi:hypothetical protein
MTSLPVARPTKSHLWKFLVFGLFLLILLCVSFIASLFFGIVPPISGTVVDAASGAPVPGMSVCLQSRVLDFGKHRIVRNEMSQTDPFGNFSFAGSIYHPDLMEHWVGYSIRVIDPRVELQPPCGAELVPGALSYYGEAIEWKTEEVGSRVYFPVAFVHEAFGPNSLPESSVRREMNFSFRIRIGMIPLLANANQCQSIQDSSLASYCAELNNSAAAEMLRQRISGSPATR